MFGSRNTGGHLCTERKVTLEYPHMQLRVKAGQAETDKVPTGHVWGQVGPNEPGINALCLGSEQEGHLELVLSRREE